MNRAARKHQRILVVEDDDLVLEQICGALEDEEYTVLQAPRVEEAFARLEDDDPHLIITDLKPPGRKLQQ